MYHMPENAHENNDVMPCLNKTYVQTSLQVFKFYNSAETDL